MRWVLNFCISVYYLVCSKSHPDIISDLSNRCLIPLFRSAIPAFKFQNSHIYPPHRLSVVKRLKPYVHCQFWTKWCSIEGQREYYQIPEPNSKPCGPDCERTADYGSNKPGYVRCWRASPLFYPAASVCGSSGINHITGLSFSTEAHRGLIITRSLHSELPV